MASGASPKNKLLFFKKGPPAEENGYCHLPDFKVGRKTPLTEDCCDDFFRPLPTRGNSDRTWTVKCKAVEARDYDLEVFNRDAKADEDLRKPEEYWI